VGVEFFTRQTISLLKIKANGIGRDSIHANAGYLCGYRIATGGNHQRVSTVMAINYEAGRTSNGGSVSCACST